MQLIKKNVTSRQKEANRRNSLKSTGPRTTTGKRNASRNALRYGLFAKSLKETFRLLGEDPADFQALVDSLREAFQPEDGFEEMLLEDMAVCRWRLNRLLRAESAIQASQRTRLDLERKWNAHCANREAVNALEDDEGGFKGAVKTRASSIKYEQILSRLKFIRDSFLSSGLNESQSTALKLVYGYGDLVGVGNKLVDSYETFSNDEAEELSSQSQRIRGQGFLELLEEQIKYFEEELALYQELEVTVTKEMKDTQLLPSRDDSDRILRYEAALERQFERKVQQLVSWRREKGKAAPAGISNN